MDPQFDIDTSAQLQFTLLEVYLNGFFQQSSCLKNMDGGVVLSPRSEMMSPVTPMKPLRIEWAEGDADFSL